MRAQQFGKWLLLLSVLVLVAACQPAQLRSAPSAAVASIAPLAMFEVTAEAEVYASAGSHAENLLRCVFDGLYQPDVCRDSAALTPGVCNPDVGEFVVTEPNGAVVTSVRTNSDGQATIDLPPGKYILGVKTENIYPLAAPVRVNVLADRYVVISLSLDSGLREQPPRE